MAEYLATYDLQEDKPDPHGPFLAATFSAGWYTVGWDVVSKSAKIMPNTTITRACKDMNEAIAKFREAHRAAERAMGRKIVVTHVAITEASTLRAWEPGEWK